MGSLKRVASEIADWAWREDILYHLTRERWLFVNRGEGHFEDRSVGRALRASTIHHGRRYGFGL